MSATKTTTMQQADDAALTTLAREYFSAWSALQAAEDAIGTAKRRREKAEADLDRLDEELAVAMWDRAARRDGGVPQYQPALLVGNVVFRLEPAGPDREHRISAAALTMAIS